MWLPHVYVLLLVVCLVYTRKQEGFLFVFGYRITQPKGLSNSQAPSTSTRFTSQVTSTNYSEKHVAVE